MRARLLTIVILALVVMGALASVAWAGSSSTTIIADASDGTVSGHYPAGQVRAALTAVENDPTYSQYSDIAGVLQDYLSSLSGSGAGASNPVSGTGSSQAPGSSSAAVPATPRGVALDYTGGQPLLLFALGGALVFAGAVLRRRWA
jgi:hypothetical protein